MRSQTYRLLGSGSGSWLWALALVECQGLRVMVGSLVFLRIVEAAIVLVAVGSALCVPVFAGQRLPEGKRNRSYQLDCCSCALVDCQL